MGFLARAISERKMTSRDLLEQLKAGRKTASGKTVSAKTAMEVSAVFACSRVIGNGIAQVPLKLLRESADGKSKLPAKDHPLYKLLSLKPNPGQTSFQWRQMVSWHVELCGNHFSYINRVGNQVLGLYPFMPNAVTVKDLGGGELEYEVTGKNGVPKTFAADQILHLTGPSWNGVTGLEVVRLAREAIGLAMATEESASSLHKNGVRTSGVYSVEGTLKDDQHKALTKWIEENHMGAENEGKPLILDRAAKWTGTQMNGVDAQALETRKNQIEEICRFFGVMPIMAGYSDKAATYASAEQMFLAHIQHCLSPRWTNYEQAFDSKLLTVRDRERDGLFFNFVEEGMIRGSIKDTKDVLLGYVNGGIMTPNEGRAKLDMNPDPDPESDKLRIPANITGVADDPDPEPTPKPQE